MSSKRELLAAHEIDQHAIEPLKPDRLVTQNSGTASAAMNASAKPSTTRLAVLRALYQPHRRLEHRDARAFGAHQRAGDMEAVLRQQLVKVVAGDAARDVRKMLAHQRCVGIANAASDRHKSRPCGRRRDGRFQFASSLIGPSVMRVPS